MRVWNHRSFNFAKIVKYGLLAKRLAPLARRMRLRHVPRFSRWYNPVSAQPHGKPTQVFRG